MARSTKKKMIYIYLDMDERIRTIYPGKLNKEFSSNFRIDITRLERMTVETLW